MNVNNAATKTKLIIVPDAAAKTCVAQWEQQWNQWKRGSSLVEWHEKYVTDDFSCIKSFKKSWQHYCLCCATPKSSSSNCKFVLFPILQKRFWNNDSIINIMSLPVFYYIPSCPMSVYFCLFLVIVKTSLSYKTSFFSSFSWILF